MVIRHGNSGKPVVFMKNPDFDQNNNSADNDQNPVGVGSIKFRHMRKIHAIPPGDKRQWEKDCGFDHIGEESLPKMKTDIVLETKDKKLPRKQLIIDAKYYSNLLKSSNFSDVGKLIPGNLYQIYAYINNSEFKGTKIGMLIYPTVETEVDYVYSIQGKKIYIKTLNLNTDWVNIKSRLMEIQKYLEI